MTEQTPTAAEVFDSLDDHGKCDFVLNEFDEIRSGLDKLIAAIGSISVTVEDPDGVVELTVGCDGRWTKLWIDPGAPARFTNLELEDKVIGLLHDAAKHVAAAREKLTRNAIAYLPPD